MFEPDVTIEVTTPVGGTVALALDDRRDGDATPLVLVHGFTGGRIDFADVTDALAGQRRVVAWDHRGHSDSTNTGDPSTYTFEVLATDAVAVLDHLGIERFHLVGHSMGGIVAQHVVRRHPGRVVSLVLMDTLAEPAGGGIPKEWIDRVVTIGRAEGMGAVADLMVKVTSDMSVALEPDRPKIAARNHHKLSHMDVEAFESLGTELREFESLVPWLGAIACPTTVLVGEHDGGLHGQADLIAASIDGATQVVIEGAGHCPQEERTVAWLEAVRAHLARADR